MADPIFEINLKNEEKDIWITVSECWEKFAYCAYNKNSNTRVELIFETLIWAIQQWCYDLFEWLK